MPVRSSSSIARERAAAEERQRRTDRAVLDAAGFESET